MNASITEHIYLFIVKRAFCELMVNERYSISLASLDWMVGQLHGDTMLMIMMMERREA